MLPLKGFSLYQIFLPGSGAPDGRWRVGQGFILKRGQIVDCQGTSTTPKDFPDVSMPP